MRVERTELAMKFSSKRLILGRGLCVAEFRAPALPGNSFDPTQPDQQGEAEGQGHCPGVKRNAEASGFFGHIGGFGFVRHCFSFSTAAARRCRADFAGREGRTKKKPDHRYAPMSGLLYSECNYLGGHSERTRTPVIRSATTRRATIKAKDTIAAETACHAANFTGRAGARQVHVLVHMISDTFGFWVWICHGAAETPTGWHSPVLGVGGWCCRCAPKLAVGGSPPAGSSTAG